MPLLPSAFLCFFVDCWVYAAAVHRVKAEQFYLTHEVITSRLGFYIGDVTLEQAIASKQPVMYAYPYLRMNHFGGSQLPIKQGKTETGVVDIWGSGEWQWPLHFERCLHTLQWLPSFRFVSVSFVGFR